MWRTQITAFKEYNSNDYENYWAYTTAPVLFILESIDEVQRLLRGDATVRGSLRVMVMLELVFSEDVLMVIHHDRLCSVNGQETIYKKENKWP